VAIKRTEVNPQPSVLFIATELSYAAMDAWAGVAIAAALASPPPGGIPGGVVGSAEVFSHDNVRRLLMAERSLPELYAMRRVRQAVSRVSVLIYIHTCVCVCVERGGVNIDSDRERWG